MMLFYAGKVGKRAGMTPPEGLAQVIEGLNKIIRTQQLAAADHPGAAAELIAVSSLKIYLVESNYFL